MGEVISVLGERTVMVKYGSQSKSLELIVVAGNGPSLDLFGINWLKHICLDWRQIAAISVHLDQGGSP